MSPDAEEAAKKQEAHLYTWHQGRKTTRTKTMHSHWHGQNQTCHMWMYKDARPTSDAPGCPRGAAVGVVRSVVHGEDLC